MNPDEALRERAQAIADRMNQAAVQLPRYRSHKEVWALKIAKVEILKPTIAELQAILDENPNQPEIPGAIITPSDPGYGPFVVTNAYVQKHEPKVGGYFVQYADGYKSWSPAEAFESGYTRVK
jgi:hypothetical protein